MKLYPSLELEIKTQKSVIIEELKKHTAKDWKLFKIDKSKYYQGLIYENGFEIKRNSALLFSKSNFSPTISGRFLQKGDSIILRIKFISYVPLLFAICIAPVIFISVFLLLNGSFYSILAGAGCLWTIILLGIMIFGPFFSEIGPAKKRIKNIIVNIK